MKKAITLSILSLAIGATAWVASAQSSPAGSPDSILVAAEADPSVKAEIGRLEADGYVRAESSKVLIGGSCGFAGCSETYLVVIVLRTQNANTRTDTVIAQVQTVPNVLTARPPEVAVVKITAA